MPTQRIADALGVTRTTIWRDLNWLRDNYAKTYGTAEGAFDTAKFIGESIAVYEDIEATALAESAKPHISALEKSRHLMVALTARAKQTQLLQDTGVVSRAPINHNINLPSAAQIRQALAQAVMDVDDDRNIIDVSPTPA